MFKSFLIQFNGGVNSINRCIEFNRYNFCLVLFANNLATVICVYVMYLFTYMAIGHMEMYFRDFFLNKWLQCGLKINSFTRATF